MLFCPTAWSADPSDTQPILLNDEWYTEGWDQLFYFPDGSLVVSQLTVHNMGFGDHRASVIGIVVEPDGKEHVLTQTRSSGEWTFADNDFDIRIADHRLSGVYPDYEIDMRKSEGEIEVGFEAAAEPWRIGKTMQLHGDYRYLSFYAPMVRANGRYRFSADGNVQQAPWVSLADGNGFAARYVNSSGLWNLIRSSTRLVPFGDSDVNPMLHTLIDENGRQITHLALFENGELVHYAEDIGLSVSYFVEKAGSDSREIPDRFDVDAKGDGFTLKGTVTPENLLLRVDPVDWVKPPVQYLLKKINTPIQYRYLGSYDLSYEIDGRVRHLQGKVLMDHIVMRHERSKFKDQLER